MITRARRCEWNGRGRTVAGAVMAGASGAHPSITLRAAAQRPTAADRPSQGVTGIITGATRSADVPIFRRGGLEPASPHKAGPARSNRAPATRSFDAAPTAPSTQVRRDDAKDV